MSNDVLNDPRLRPWHEVSRRHGARASAAIPIIRDQSSIGVFLFSLSEVGSLTDEIVALIERMVENVSFGLKIFEREQQQERVSRMFAALSATNEAIIRAETREELCELVCEAAALGGTFICTRIAFVEPTSGDSLRIVAAAGRGKDTARGILVPLDVSHSEGLSASEIAFKSGRLH